MPPLARTGAAAAALLVPLAALAADWPQWNGPRRDGTSPETGLLQTWPRQGPPLAWTFADGGTGFSAPAVVGGRAYTMGTRQDVDQVIAVDDKGKELWHADVGAVFDFKTNVWNRGPSCTPAVAGDALYAVGSQGVVVCVETGTGQVRWKKDLPRELDAQVNPVGGGPENFGWGFAWSPLVDGDRVIVAPGGPKGLLAALDARSGSVLWQSKEMPEQVTYSSPVAMDVGGTRMYVQMVQDGAAGVGRGGELLWRYKRDSAYPDVVCPTPLVKGDLVYLTAWGAGSELLRLVPDGKKFKPEVVYSNKNLGNRQGGVVLVGNYLYGFNEARAWVCQDFMTGEVKWASTRRGVGAGSVAYADGRLYVQAEDKDEVVLLEASPAGYKEAGRFTLPRQSPNRRPRGKLWTHPVLADGRLYLRDQELLFCYKIK
jgi:outer membrane protein assembly factor BamB